MSLVILIFYPSPAASLKRDADAALQDASLTLQQRAAFRYPNLPPPAAGPNRRSSANFATASNSCSKRSRTPACSALPLLQANPIRPCLATLLPPLRLRAARRLTTTGHHARKILNSSSRCCSSSSCSCCGCSRRSWTSKQGWLKIAAAT